MAKRSDDRDVEILTENWISINKKQDPIAWQAWADWRRNELRSLIDPENFTVPTPFPPSTVAAAKEYIAIVQQIRKSVGWNDSRAQMPKSVGAWMGT